MQTHTHMCHCMSCKYVSRTHKGAHTVCTHTHTHTQIHIPLHCRNGRKGTGWIFRWLQSRPITQQVTSTLFQSKPIRDEDELTLLSYLGPDLLPLCDTLNEAACALHMGACVIHTQKQAGSQAARPVCERLTETFFCYPGALASTKHPHHHQLFTTSAVCPCASVCLCACVCMSVRITVCVVTICSHQIFGEPRSCHSSLRSCFCSLLPGTWACFCGYRRKGTQCFIYGLCSADSHWPSSGSSLLLARDVDCFCHASCLELSFKLWTWLKLWL